MPSRNALASAATWVGTNEAIARLVRRTPRSVHVRYEDLDRVRETGLVRHVPGLGGGAGRAFGHSHAIAGNPARFNRHQAVVVDARWRSEMPRARRAVVSALTAPTGLRYGYPSRPGRRTRAG